MLKKTPGARSRDKTLPTKVTQRWGVGYSGFVSCLNKCVLLSHDYILYIVVCVVWLLNTFAVGGLTFDIQRVVCSSIN